MTEWIWNRGFRSAPSGGFELNYCGNRDTGVELYSLTGIEPQCLEKYDTLYNLTINREQCLSQRDKFDALKKASLFEQFKCNYATAHYDMR